MGKLKTHKGTAKRIWKTGSGKLMHRHAARSHHRARKTVNQGLHRGQAENVAQSNPRVSELIPYQ
jgi:ribosomal protein L35